MKNNNENLDAYRNERKDRLSKQAKNSDKKRNSHEGAKKAFSKVVSAIISIVIVVAILFGILNFFGVPQKALRAVTIDGKSYSMSELSCYYISAYNNVRQMAAAYDSNYGEGMGKTFTGYDVNLSPAEQTTKDEDGNEITWDEYFLDQAIHHMADVKRYYAKAVENKVELTDEDNEQIEETLNTIKENSGMYSESRFISKNFGKGVGKSLYKKIVTEQLYASRYQSMRQDELKAKYDDAAVDAEYIKDITAYDVVDFRWYAIDVEKDDKAEAASGDEEVALATAEARAQAMIDKITSTENYNEETFKKAVLDDADPKSDEYKQYQDDAGTKLKKTTMASVKSTVNEDAANWMFEQKDGKYVRQAGDIRYFVNSSKDTVYVIYTLGVPYKNDTKAASVRHILVKFPEAGSEEASDTADVNASAKAQAESILKEYKDYIDENNNGKADEDYFAELASKKTDDTGSAKDGGLISDMENNGAYVRAFEDWAFAQGEFAGEERSEGATAIIESEFGYHIMFFVGSHDHPSWYEAIQNDLVAEDWSVESENFENEHSAEDAKPIDFFANRVMKSCLKMLGF